MVENTEWGRKTIFTPNDLEEFFQLLYPILKTTPYDDPVLPDFGEIKLNYRSKYYSVITGTGHTAPIFSALQFLEKISESACMDAYTDSLLCYSDYCIDFLKAKNTPINEDFSLHPQFESPTFDYYENVKDFMTEEKWTGLGTPLLSMLAAESNEIVRSHFFSYNDHYYPLFNPSLVIDYQTKILLTRPDRELHSIVISSLADKLASIYDSHDIKTDYTIRKPLLLDNKQPLLDNKKSFAYLEDSNLIVFLDCGNEHRIEEEISAIYKAHTEDGLSIVDLEARIPGKGYKAYHVDKECKLSIICFDEHINVDQPRIVLRGREEKRIYTAIDLMYMLMFSSEVSQIAEFDSDEKNSESQVLSWGGASDYFTVFLSEKGFISKGAIEYSNNDYIYSPIIMEEVRKRWIEGFLQFYPPFEIGLERTCTALYAWKNNYEHLFSSEVEVLLKESGCEYAKHDVDLRREDRRGNHPTIDVLGDYDVIGLNTTQKRIFIIECKVLQPIGSVFEHSNQQKRFFTKEKFDEKFQKRIDYFSKVAMSFFANHGYDTEGFTINPYMVVNKVFSSYYKHVQFPIVTFDELKREIQL